MPSLMLKFHIFCIIYSSGLWIVHRICQKSSGIKNMFQILGVFKKPWKTNIMKSLQKCSYNEVPTTTKRECLPICGINSSISLSIAKPFSKFSFVCLPTVSSSATKEVVILTRGKMAILDTWLNTAMETPTAASSTAPVRIIHRNHILKGQVVIKF